ncbi:MAG: TPR REGION domain-containing protein [Bacteroidetes bacterium]|nr:TPR REGION domain-containing protein [Bacteroidota bacterium]
MSGNRLVLAFSMKSLILHLTLLSFLFSSMPAQVTYLEPQVDSLLSKADELVFESRKELAKELYRSALKSSKDPIRVLAIEGKIALADESWRDARSRLESLLKRDPKNMFGHYGLGICFREIGKQSIFLNRLRGVLLKTDWDESKEHFQFVLASDSSFNDVLYQYSLLLKCQGDYPDALEAARAQLRLSPKMFHAQIGLYKLYKSFVFNGSPQVVFEWLREQSTEYATYFIGEEMRRAGMLDQAESLFLDMLKLRLDMPLQPIYLSLSKINYARDRTDLGESYYWRAVNEITTRIGLQIVLDGVHPLLTDDELGEFASLRTLRDRGRFVRSIWISRNPTPGSQVNPRLAEHHKRLLHAEAREHYDGDRTHANNPDKMRQLQFPKAYWLNDEFNDKGLIYIRHGPPDNIQKYLGEEILAPTESWMYSSRPDAPEMIFHFTMEGGLSNNWRLVRFPPYPKAWEDLASWDPVFYRLSRAEPSEREILSDRISSQTQETVMAALSTDRHTWKEEQRTFPIPFSVDAFRSEGGR